MSSHFGYLIPDKPFDIGEFKRMITTIFKNSKIIDGYYDEKYSWFCAGDNSHSMFSKDNDDDNSAFEYVEIHDTINKRLIPDCSSQSYGAKCSKCKVDIEDAFMEVFNKLADMEFDGSAETDMTSLSVKCENCEYLNKLFEIKFDVETKITNQYMCFVEIDGDFNKDLVKKISKILNCNFSIIYGSL